MFQLDLMIQRDAKEQPDLQKVSRKKKLSSHLAKTLCLQVSYLSSGLLIFQQLFLVTGFNAASNEQWASDGYLPKCSDTAVSLILNFTRMADKKAVHSLNHLVTVILGSEAEDSTTSRPPGDYSSLGLLAYCKKMEQAEVVNDYFFMVGILLLYFHMENDTSK